jgi:hypothetical protein
VTSPRMVRDFDTNFNSKYAISTPQNLSELLEFSRIASMLQVNGREIFLKKREEAARRESRQRSSRNIQATEFFEVKPSILLQRLRLWTSMMNAS